MKTSLYEKHVGLNAKIVDFAGWEMPISYTSLKEEILEVRNGCGFFDVSHMGEFFIEGSQACEFMDYLIPADFQVANGKAVYSPLLNHDGKILDDLIAYKLSDQLVMICVNASNIEKDWKWISKIYDDSNFDCKIYNRSSEYSLIAIQGPKSEEFLKNQLGVVEDLDYYGIKKLENSHGNFIVARTGYTGEDGFEVFGGHSEIGLLWDRLITAGVRPCGLGARDTLRVEVCYPLYGHELSENLTPYDCNLKWTVKSKVDYVGKKSLDESTPKYKLVKISLDRGIPREGYKVLSSGQEVGIVTSGTMSPVISKGIALARVERQKTEGVKSYQVEIRGKTYEANYHTKPFINGGHK